MGLGQASWLKITEGQLILAQAKRGIYSKDSILCQGKQGERQADLGLKPSPQILPKLMSLFSLLVSSLSTDSLPLSFGWILEQQLTSFVNDDAIIQRKPDLTFSDSRIPMAGTDWPCQVRFLSLITSQQWEQVKPG